MKKTALISVFIVLFGAIILSACNNGSKKDNTEVIKVGAIIPLSGGDATYGQSLKKGFEIAVAEDSGKFRIIYEDSKADKNTGISAINKLISSDNIKFVLGDATSGVTLAIAPIAEKNKIILLDPIATSDDIIKAGDYIFSNAPSNYKQAIKAASFILNDLKVKKIAILYGQTDYGVNLSNKFKAELKTQNVTPVYESGYQNGSVDYKTALTKIKESKAGAVFVPGNYGETANMIKQAREMGITIPFIGTDGAYSPALIEIAGTATIGFYLTMFGVDKNSEMYKSFSSAYKSQYNAEPDVFTCYGYESAKIMFEAISKAGNDPEKVKQYLYNNSFSSFTGPLKFDSDGMVIRDYVILTVKNGSFEINK